jgi:glyceraldehyde 3-phosphate dehydrogenase
MVKVGFNGFGRIGRAFYRLSKERDDVEVVAVNDLGSVENLAYLLQYDTAYGKAPYDVTVSNGNLLVDGREIQVVSERDPANLPWGKLDVDVVVEATGVFRKFEDAEVHVTKAGAKKVVISAPAKSEPQNDTHATILMGVNDEQLKTCVVTSNASCTTNAGSPLMTILDETIGVEKALLNTIHAYTATQSIVDSPSKGDFRKGRAAAMNIIPSTTGAAIATAKALPQLENKFDGIALRVPVIAGSIADITFISKKNTTVEEVNAALKEAAQQDRWKGIFAVNEDPIVSRDILGNTHAAIADLSFTKVVDGNLVKVLSWYDNEMGYTGSLVEHVVRTGSHL